MPHHDTPTSTHEHDLESLAWLVKDGQEITVEEQAFLRVNGIDPDTGEPLADDRAGDQDNDSDQPDEPHKAADGATSADYGPQANETAEEPIRDSEGATPAVDDHLEPDMRSRVAEAKRLRDEIDLALAGDWGTPPAVATRFDEKSPPTPKEEPLPTLEEYKALASRNSVRRFLNDHFARDERGKAKAGETFDRHRAGAADGRYYPVNLRAFPATMTALGITSKVEGPGKVYRGLRERQPGDALVFLEDEMEPEPEWLVCPPGGELRCYWAWSLTAYRSEIERAKAKEERAYRIVLSLADDPGDPEMRIDCSLSESLEVVYWGIWAVLADTNGQKFLDRDLCTELRDLAARFDALAKPEPPAPISDWVIDGTGYDTEPRYVPQASRVVLPGASDPVALPLGAGAGQPFEEPGS